jgi:anti-anti-sigma factor
VWEVEGELDLLGGASLRDATTSLPDRGRLLYVNVSGVSFIDCSGLAALVDLSRRCHDHGVHLVVTGAGAQVLRLIAMTDTHRELNVVDGLGVAHGPACVTVTTGRRARPKPFT